MTRRNSSRRRGATFMSNATHRDPGLSVIVRVSSKKEPLCAEAIA